MTAFFNKHANAISSGIGWAMAILFAYLSIPHLMEFFRMAGVAPWKSPVEAAPLFGLCMLLTTFIFTFLAFESYRHSKASGKNVMLFALFLFVFALMWLIVLTFLIGWLYIGSVSWFVSIGVKLAPAQIAATVFILLIVAISSRTKK